MITIKIGEDERKLELSEPQWIIRAIRGERQEHGRACVLIRFYIPGIKLSLPTPDCSCSRSRPIKTFNDEEQRLIERWKEMGLFDDPNFPPDKIVAFVEYVNHYFSVHA